MRKSQVTSLDSWNVMLGGAIFNNGKMPAVQTPNSDIEYDPENASDWYQSMTIKNR
jgi:hypothetical protein